MKEKFWTALTVSIFSCTASMAKTATIEEMPGTVDGVKISMPTSFQEVNDKFRQIYAETRSRTLKKSEPIIVVFGDHMVLIDQSRRDSSNFISDKFNLLKSVCHIVLATFVALELDTDQRLSESKLKQIRELESFSKKALSSLDKSGLKGEVLDRQRQLINTSLNVMETALKDKKVSAIALRDFCRNNRKMIEQNVDESVADQLLAVDYQVKQWRKELPKDKWDALKVVIVSGHMPRERQSNLQYFQKLFKVKREGSRIYYCEGLSEESDGLNLVGTHILDREIAINFFNDEWRMHRDLLSDGAAQYLSKHPPLK